MASKAKTPSYGRTALDVDCPICHSVAGVRCTRDRMCQPRIDLAASLTRRENAALRTRSSDEA